MCRKGLKKGLCRCLITFAFLFMIHGFAWAVEIPDGIYIGDQNLGGMTTEEVSQVLQEKVVKMGEEPIVIYVEETPVETTATNLGLYWSNPEVVEEAAQMYQGGNLIERYLALTELAQNNVTLPFEVGLQEERILEFLQEQCVPLLSAPVDATIRRENGAFIVTESVLGKTMDIEASKELVKNTYGQAAGSISEVHTVVVESPPRIVTEDLASIQDVLGTYSTSFSGSSNARITNLRVGAEKINGKVLLPGEELSGYESMKPFTTANGYATASAYENGQVVDSIGGGVCQIATTIYNTALRAEVEITQRQNHSMTVGYVKPSEDAAIAGTYKDIKFRNNYSTPIYVEGILNGKTLTFTIYGKETRPSNRTFQFVSETLSVTDPGEPTLQIDPSLPAGKRVQVQSSHKGMKSRLWKYVYMDGVEQSRELLHTDTYRPSKAIVKVGPDQPVVAPIESSSVEVQPTDQPSTQPVLSEPNSVEPFSTEPSSEGTGVQ